MKILVFGAGGQVGSEIIAEFEQRGYLSSVGIQVVPVTRAEVDLTDYTQLLSFLDSQAPDWIVNASAYTYVDKAEIESETAFSVNQGAVQCMADYCCSTNSKILHLSTDYVFDGGGTSPLSEDDSVSPGGIYGASKLAGESAIRDTLRRHIILRVAWVFGASGNNFVKTMLRLAQSKAVLKVVDDRSTA